MNEEAKAINEWYESTEAKGLFDRSTIGASNEYLASRLCSAFVAGMKAGREIEREAIEKRLLAMLRGDK